MINAFIIDSENETFEILGRFLKESFPSVHLKGYATSLKALIQEKIKIHLLFINTQFLNDQEAKWIMQELFPCELICVSSQLDQLHQAFQYNAFGFLLKPFQKEAVVQEIERLQKKLARQKENASINHTGLIGIPTIDGYEYVKVDSIICCEGMHKCTRIITTKKTNLVSAYNIGEFNKLLSTYGFYAPHKSYLINLNHVTKYCKDGTIYLTNSHHAPVSRRRRTDFLKKIPHL